MTGAVSAPVAGPFARLLAVLTEETSLRNRAEQ